MAKYKNTYAPFDRLKFGQNPALSEQLFNDYDDAIDTLNVYVEENDSLKAEITRLTDSKKTYKMTLEAILPNTLGSMGKFVFSLSATILVAYGVNLLTGGQFKFDWGGIITIIVGILISLGIFYFDLTNSKKKADELIRKSKINDD